MCSVRHSLRGWTSYPLSRGGLGDFTGVACELVLTPQLVFGGNPPVVVEPMHLEPDSPSGSHHRLALLAPYILS